MNKTPITVAHGDGIGPEIMAAALHVLQEAGAQLDIETIAIGEQVYLRGNMAVSAYPVLDWSNQDVSHHRFESRGHLLASIKVPGWDVPLTVVCVHLGLWQKSRTVQIAQLIDMLNDAVPNDEPLVVAGDFNDWRAKRGGISKALKESLGLCEVFEEMNGKPARTFPAIFPMLTLDRIYMRGLKIDEVLRLHGEVEGVKWRGLSDHVGLAVRLSR